MRLPGTSRRWPSVTTVSPAARPSLITVSVPADARDGDRPQLHGLVRLDEVDVRSRPGRSARQSIGTTIAADSVVSRTTTLTNWPGQSRRSSLGNVPLILIVPVV